MTLKNSNIAQANPDVPANADFINALFFESSGRKATSEELEKFVGMTVKDAANTILGASLSPFSEKRKQTQKLIWPLDKVQVTQKFGENPQIYSKFGMKGHDGIDLRTRYFDSPLAQRKVRAAHDAIVQDVRWDKTGYGTHIRLYQQGFGMTIYGHLSKILVSKGQHVSQGEIIGITGNTGFSSGPHLHFEVRPDPLQSGNGYAGAVDPRNYL